MDVWLSICTAILVLFGIYCLNDPSGVWELGFADSDGMMIFCFGFVAFTGLIGGIMIHHNKKWMKWSTSQRMKSSQQLESESLAHSFQPAYECDQYFTI